MSSLSASGARRRLRSTRVAAEQLHPPCTGEGVEAERDEPQRDNAEEPAPVRLAQEEQDRPAETLCLARSVMQACLDQKPTDDQESHASGGHPEPAQPNG